MNKNTDITCLVDEVDEMDLQDQQKYREAIKDFFSALYANLNSYFARDVPITEQMFNNNRDPQFVGAMTYVHLYRLIQDDWENLCPQLKKLEDIEKGIRLSTPRECLTSILHCDCKFFLESYLSIVTEDGSFLRLEIEKLLKQDLKNSPFAAVLFRYYKGEYQILKALISPKVLTPLQQYLQKLKVGDTTAVNNYFGEFVTMAIVTKVTPGFITTDWGKFSRKSGIQSGDRRTKKARSWLRRLGMNHEKNSQI